MRHACHRDFPLAQFHLIGLPIQASVRVVRTFAAVSEMAVNELYIAFARACAITHGEIAQAIGVDIAQELHVLAETRALGAINCQRVPDRFDCLALACNGIAFLGSAKDNIDPAVRGVANQDVAKRVTIDIA